MDEYVILKASKVLPSKFKEIGPIENTYHTWKDGEVLDGGWDLYPHGRHARVTIPVD